MSTSGISRCLVLPTFFILAAMTASAQIPDPAPKNAWLKLHQFLQDLEESHAKEAARVRAEREREEARVLHYQAYADAVLLQGAEPESPGDDPVMALINQYHLLKVKKCSVEEFAAGVLREGISRDVFRQLDSAMICVREGNSISGETEPSDWTMKMLVSNMDADTPATIELLMVFAERADGCVAEALTIHAAELLKNKPEALVLRLEDFAEMEDLMNTAVQYEMSGAERDALLREYERIADNAERLAALIRKAKEAAESSGE